MRALGYRTSFGLVALAAITFACSGERSASSEPPQEAPDQLTVRISVERDSLLLGTSRLFSASVVNQFNAPRTKVVQWSSTNASVLTVTSQGLVTAIGAGSAQIVAGISGSADTLNLSVFGLPGTLKVTPEAVSLPVGDEIQVQALTGPMAGAGGAVQWTSSDTSIAQVNAEGVVSAVHTGDVLITANLGGSFAKAGVEVFAPTLASLSISPTVTSIATGSTVNLSVSARSTAGKKIGGRMEVVWSSSNPDVARIDQQGRVTGISRGFATIQASAYGKTATASVNVTSTAASSIIATLPDSSLVEGQSVVASAVVRDASGAVISGLAVAWQSSSPNIATVDASGRVNALVAGVTTISAISGGKIGSVALSVSKGAVTSVSILPASPSVLVGASAQLTGQVLDQNGKAIVGQSIIWKSSTPSVATINATGLLTGVSAGVVDITATSGAYTTTVKATVTLVSVASVTISPATATVQNGASLSLVATAKDAGGNILTGRVMKWTSSNPLVLSISSSGTATGVGTGKAEVIVEAEGKKAFAAVEVLAPAPSAVASIDLVANAPVLNVGQTTQAVATLRDAAGNTLSGNPITWTSLDAAVATVSSAGLITATGGGSVAIIATSGGVSGSLAITVNTPAAATVASVSVSLAPDEIPGGQSSKATVTLKDAQGQVLTGRTVTYASSNVTVASVGAGGTVMGISVGEAGISASAEGQTGKAYLHVTSGTSTVSRVVVNVSPTTLNVGASTYATASASDAAGSSVASSFTWASSDPSVAAIGSNGLVTALAPGNSTISATSTSSGTTGTLGITVSSSAPVAVASVTLTLGSASLPTGQTTQATAVARDAGGAPISGLSVAYSSSNTAVATVSSAGTVTALSAGTVTLSASIGGKVGSAPLTVTTAAPPPTSTPPASAAAALAKIGPTVTPAAAASLGAGYAKYDALWAKWEPTRWTAEGAAWSGNYYDRAQIYYAQWIRTGNSTYKQRGDAMALDYRRNYLHVNNYQTSPHWSQLDGLALHYWLTGDDSSRIAVGKAAWNLAGSAQWLRTGLYTDARQQARALQAMLLAWQINAPNAPTGGWAKALDDGLNVILPQQSPDGAWRYPANTCDMSLNYMGAMLSDALIRVYTQYRADPRIPGTVKKSADFLWTQLRTADAIPSFKYYEGICVNQHGSAGPTATPDLTGLYVSMYAWMSAQDPAYRAKSDLVFDATMNGMYPQGSKQFNQAFAFGWRALGYLQ